MLAGGKWCFDDNGKNNGSVGHGVRHGKGRDMRSTELRLWSSDYARERRGTKFQEEKWSSREFKVDSRDSCTR